MLHVTHEREDENARDEAPDDDVDDDDDDDPSSMINSKLCSSHHCSDIALTVSSGLSPQ